MDPKDSGPVDSSAQWIERLAPFMGKSGWDRGLAGAEIRSAGGGAAEVRVPVDERVANLLGALHGGAIATLVDDVGTLAILTADRQGRPGVTTDLHVTYMASTPVGGAVLVRARVRKIGRTMAFVGVEIVRESDGVVAAEGLMTKHLG